MAANDRNDLEDGDEDSGLAELIPLYFALCRRDLLSLRTALEGTDFNQVRILGHNLRGSGGAYGFPELSEIGAVIETAGKTKDADLARDGIAKLAGFLEAHQESKA